MVFSGHAYTYYRNYAPSSFDVVEEWVTIPLTVTVKGVQFDSISFESGNLTLVSNHPAVISVRVITDPIIELFQGTVTEARTTNWKVIHYFIPGRRVMLAADLTGIL